jgi:hypothetical protein
VAGPSARLPAGPAAEDPEAAAGPHKKLSCVSSGPGCATSPAGRSRPSRSSTAIRARTGTGPASWTWGRRADQADRPRTSDVVTIDPVFQPGIGTHEDQRDGSDEAPDCGPACPVVRKGVGRPRPLPITGLPWVALIGTDRRDRTLAEAGCSRIGCRTATMTHRAGTAVPPTAAYSRASIAAASRARSMYGSPLTSTATRLIVPPVNLCG